jgi:serine/threonine protein kinase
MNPLGDIYSVQTPQWVQDLIVPCFDPNPTNRPSFAQLCQKLEQAHPAYFAQYMTELDAPRSVLTSPSSTRSAAPSSTSGGKWVKSAKNSNAVAPDFMQQADASQIKLIAKLGEGSFGTVHLVQLKDGKFVALKKLNPGSSSADAHREASVMTQLPRHPNLVQMLGIFVEKGQLSILMELVAKGSLESFVHRWWKSTPPCSAIQPSESHVFSCLSWI